MVTIPLICPLHFNMKPLFLFNAITQTLDVFQPSNSRDVKIYCCGPTVYNVPHLGHARTYVFMDVLRRILYHYLGYGVRLVMNVTDLDDKIIAEGGLSIAQKYEKDFFKTMKRLNVQRPNFTPHVTECLELTTNLWKQCMTEKFAYFTRDLDIYFHTKAYLEKFGRVFPDTEKRDLSQSEAIKEEDGKWDPRDFAVWKESKQWIDAEGNQHTGMPGWHTECAAMAIFHFHDTVDIHLGGIDLQFPHHENEIALGRVYFDKKDWVRYCLYTGHLEIEGRKMSKSLKNFITVEEMLNKGYSPLAIRYMFLKHPYDKPMHFHEDELKRAQQSYKKFMNHIEKMKSYRNQLALQPTVEELQGSWARCNGLNKLKLEINDALMNNVNVSKALEKLEDFVQMYSLRFMKNMSYEWMCYCLQYVLFLVDTCFGLVEHPSKDDNNESNSLYPIFKKFRSNVREWALKKELDEMQPLLEMCDKAREDINRIGYCLEDDK